MELKCLIVSLLIGTALAVNGSNECSENGAQACIDALLEKVLDSSTDDDDMCTLLNEAAQCLRDTVQECLGDERDEDIDKALDEMDAQISEKCPAADEMDIATTGTTLAESDSELCSQSRVEACVDTLIEKTLSTDEEEMCPVLREASQCLRDTAQACLGDETDEDIDAALDQMDAQIGQKCGDESDEELSDEDQQCVKENEDYIMSCISESITEVTQMTVSDHNVLKCALYSLVTDCVTTRVVEKCGEEVGAVVKKEFDDMPEEIAEACNNTEEPVDVFSVSLLEMKKKRK